MALKTLGEQLEEVQESISRILNARSLSENGKQIDREPLFRLEQREQKLLTKIATYGSDYIEGQNSKPNKAAKNVIFS